MIDVTVIMVSKDPTAIRVRADLGISGRAAVKQPEKENLEPFFCP